MKFDLTTLVLGAAAIGGFAIVTKRHRASVRARCEAQADEVVQASGGTVDRAWELEQCLASASNEGGA